MAFTFLGASPNFFTGFSIDQKGDVDGDGQNDILIGVPQGDISGPTGQGAVYLLDDDQLTAADAADGTTDGFIDVENIPDQALSYRFLGEFPGDGAGISVSFAGDVDGDGQTDILIGAPFQGTGGTDAGAAYLINADDLAAADAADGTTDGSILLSNVALQPKSFKFIGEDAGDLAGTVVGTAGDIDNDGQDDILISATSANLIPFGTGGFTTGAVYVINADDLTAADAADSTVDGFIDLSNIAGTGDSYEIIGSITNQSVGGDLDTAGNVDNDPADEFLIGVPSAGVAGNTAFGETYLVDATDLAAADAADSTTDGMIISLNLDAQASSYVFVGADGNDRSGFAVSSGGDTDGDGQNEIFIGAPSSLATGGFQSGKAYILDQDALAAADGADGSTDGEIDLDNVAAQTNSYEFINTPATNTTGAYLSFADIDDDGLDDLLISAAQAEGGATFGGGEVYILNAKDFDDADAADGSTDGVIDVTNIAAQDNSYQVQTNLMLGFLGDVSGSDVTGDGLDDILLGAPNQPGDPPSTQPNIGKVYFIDASLLDTLDAADGVVDGIIQAENINCFAHGTVIATRSGDKPVQDLRIGEPVLTADGRAVPVKWVGRQTIVKEFAQERAQMVCIAKGALGNHSDLYVTADHGMVIDGIVVNASVLVNGLNITWVPYHKTADRFTVYHVETHDHDVIFANGAASETYLDIPGRRVFDNYDEYIDRYGEEHCIAESDMPRVSAHRLLPHAIREKIARAAAKQAAS